MLDRLSRTLESHVRAISLRGARSEVLAANIANADTPHYKARDFDFRSAYQGKLKAADLALARTSERHLPATGARGPSPELQWRNPVQPSIDGNTVELDAEVGRYSDNALRYQAALQFTSLKIRGLMGAIQGQ